MTSEPSRAIGEEPRPDALGMPTAEEHASSASVEDYVKAIYSLTHRGDAASTSALAHRLGITPGSVSAMLKRMDAMGVVEHVPYQGVRLTTDGERLALGVLRRHRLIEQFLNQTLDIPWQDVDRFAERLEHAVSDELVEIIATKLGDPETDPHGDPIPDRQLQLVDPNTRRLDELAAGEYATVVRVSDADPEMLRHLTEQQIAIGDRFEMVGQQPFGGPIEIQIAGEVRLLGPELASAIRVA